MYKIPLTNAPNQTLAVTVPIDGENKSFVLNLNYNGMAKYWECTIRDYDTQSVIISRLPLLCSQYNFANLLGQFSHLEIGTIIIAIINGNGTSMPNDTDLGTGYIMAWGDTQDKNISLCGNVRCYLRFRTPKRCWR